MPELPLAPDPPTQQIAVSSRYCGSCGASMAGDQRYCVECGQRRGPAHPALPGQLAQRIPAATGAAPRRRGPRLNVNAALIAGVGTLMLAMGTGVLIGRTAAGGGSGSGAVQLVTVPGTVGTSSGVGGSGSTATEPGAAGQAGESAGKAAAGSGSSAPSKSKAKRSGKSGKSSSSSSSGSEAGSGSQEGAGSEKAAVKIGEAGKGPGYKKGHFTGEFFGGG